MKPARLRQRSDEGAFSVTSCEEEFYEQNPEERLRRQFMTDPLRGGGEGDDR